MLQNALSIFLALSALRLLEWVVGNMRARAKALPPLLKWRYWRLRMLVEHTKFPNGSRSRYKTLLNLRSKKLQAAIDEDQRQYSDIDNAIRNTYQRKYYDY
ncbi:hypothetical protein [Hymenobacter sp. BT491]|uniref:hypothetical protein n=1 Tax=Hymenobacter sp. BT491 TaxID=2766779 RepID=UPI00165365A7|nr:hypothetical protein [Hymenobacter sp. BT491]MBC6988949.1 hypothetical protein [Hymenobacter sp. BT491]